MCTKVSIDGELDSSAIRIKVEEFDDCPEWAVVEQVADKLLGVVGTPRRSHAIARISNLRLARVKRMCKR